MTTPDLPPVGATVTDANGETHRRTAKGWNAVGWDLGWPIASPSHAAALTVAWRAEQRLAAIDAACLEVCRDNHGPTVGDHAVDPDAGRYVCLNEDGEPFIDTSDPVEVIRTLDRLWWETSERCEKQEQRVKELEEWDSELRQEIDTLHAQHSSDVSIRDEKINRLTRELEATRAELAHQHSSSGESHDTR